MAFDHFGYPSIGADTSLSRGFLLSQNRLTHAGIDKAIRVPPQVNECNDIAMVAQCLLNGIIVPTKKS